VFERLRAERRRRALGRELARGHPAPERAWEGDYGDRHAALLAWAFESGELRSMLAAGRRLPDNYGAGLDERVVEFPWLVAQRPFGRLLDAGSTLNHAHILDRFQPHTTSLFIATLRPEPVAYTERGISYVYADLRDLPFRAAFFDTVICASTIEHVGMDNSVYGDDAPRAAEPAAEQAAALSELIRVTAPGGRILLTLPYGRAEDHRWFRQYDEATLRALLERADGVAVDVQVYAYSTQGWQQATLESARDATYKDHHADKSPAPDRAAAARAVACVRLTRAAS
jgi:SAM-dependent methyltransferase